MTKKLFASIVVIALSLCVTLCACTHKDVTPAIDKNLTVTLMNGENYSVEGDNKKSVKKGDDVSFNVRLDRGYQIVSAYGDECVVTEYRGFEQTVTFTDVRYKSSLRLETEEIEKVPLTVTCRSSEQGRVEITSALGQAEQDSYYINDTLSVTAKPNDGYRFWCWSIGGYVNEGGQFYSYGADIENYNLLNSSLLCANFKSLSDVKDRITYRFGSGKELEQDCTELLAHHYRANTLTAVDLRENGVDCESKLLAGWQTQDGEFVTLGGRTSVNPTNETILFPVWKEYTSSEKFTVDGGAIIRYDGSDTEVVIPREINGVKITSIKEDAFIGSVATTYYLPDTIDTVEQNAFKGCEALNCVYMSDNVMDISDSSFSGCKNFTTLYLNAYRKPCYTSTFWGGKMEAYDGLAANRNNGKTKLAILGGSSVLWGYSSAQISQDFKQYGIEAEEVYNLGFYANVCGYALFELVRDSLSENDVFLHAPEGAISWSGDMRESALTGGNAIFIDLQFMYLVESNLQFISCLTINRYCNFFDLFTEWNSYRSHINPVNYAFYDGALGVNEDGRPNTSYETIGPERGLDENGEQPNFGWGRVIVFNSILESGVVYARDNIYNVLAEKNVNVFVTFAPIDKTVLLNSYGNEDLLYSAADNYTQSVKDILSSSDAIVLLEQASTIYEAEHFSNSDFHLGDPFRKQHTSNVITALLESLKEQGKI